MNQKTEIESQDVIEAEDSVSSTEENRGKLDSKKKVRSMKLQRSPSRRRKPHNDRPIEASPNYMKATSSSNAKDGFEIAPRLVRNKTLTRMSTLKLKKSLTRKLSGKTEQKRKLKSSRSIKLATVKGTKSTTMLHSDSESIHDSDGKNGNSTSDAGNKSQRVMTRRLSLKPVRISSKKPSLHKATCSSTIKDSHFPNHIDLQQEGSSSHGVSAVKVCPYTYCSLHGHRHGDVPPLKRFVSMRRRQLKSQKSTKKDGRSKQVGNARKATQKTKTVHIEDGNSHLQNVKSAARETSPFKPHDTPPSTVDECDTSTKHKNVEPDYEVLPKSFAQEEPKSGSTTSVAYGVQERDQKYITKWHLMYKHAVLSNTGKCENKLPLAEKENGGRKEDNEENNSSCHNYSETDSDMDDEKKNVIELVQKAFDEILLPEAENLSSYDHSKSRGNETDEVLLEKSEGKIEEKNTTTFTESPKEVKKMESKLKNWSHLKKVILLKRFVKALEKVRNINSIRPRQLPSDANFEAEKVFLNRQTEEERKKSEEWMLDYALQKVISKLAPVQRQRVTLLIEAFETIRPIQDAENGPQSSAKVESQTSPIQSLDASPNHNKEEIIDGRDYEATERARNDMNMAACKKNDESATVESTSTDVVKFPVFDIGISEEEVTSKRETMEPDYEVLQKSVVQEEPKNGSSTTGVQYGVQERDQKYIKKWHLMYKHAVLSNTGKCENKLPFVGKDKEGREEDGVAFDGGNSSSCNNYSETDSDMDDEKKNIVELVQKAFDEILLPETEDLSSDDHLKSRSYGSDEVLLKKSEGEREERNATSFTDSPKEAQKIENKPKSWSHLKKLILLKRFVKALDKVRNINPRRPRELASDAKFEAEKVFLNRQTSEERKKSEEWMLDYALQKVISKLAPAQRQRVTLLIEAFETIRPFQDAENGLRSSATVESQENPIQSLDASSNHNKEEINNRRDSVLSAKSLLGKVSFSNDSTTEFSDKASDNPMPELCKPIEPVEAVSSSHEEVPTNQIVDEVPEDMASDFNTKTKNVIGGNNEQFSVTKSLILNGLVRSLRSNLVVPEAPSKLLDEPATDIKDEVEKDQPKTSEAPTTSAAESENRLEKQGNKGLWFMVYKHMVSDMDENNSKTLTDAADEKESKYEDATTSETSVSYESTPLPQTLNVYPSSSTRLQFSFLHSKLNQPRFSSFSLRIRRNPRFQPIICSSSNVQPKKHSPSSSTRNKNLNNNDNKKKKNNNKSNGETGDSNLTSNSSLPQIPTPLPKPPSGFVVDDTGKLLTSSNDRLATLVDPANNLPLECVIRRVFTSSRGDQCMLLCPLDMPVQILQSTGDGWSEVSYEELEPLLPAASFALAKLRMHLVYSGYCYTARGGFCYSEEDIFDFHADGKDDDGLATEGVEITHFNQEAAHYMMYTPSDPLLFVAAKDQNGMLQIADDELLEDPAVISAIDEETEFNALVEEEAALLESLLGK